MTMTRRARVRAAALLAAAVAGMLAWPGPAEAAEVTITTAPAQVHQGDAVEVTFVLPEERSGARTERIEVRMPADAPVGEVYPLSVPGWAPRITTRTLDRPVAGIHAPELDQVTDAVTWIRMPGAASGAARLPLGMGPMPAADRLVFQVVQTYADGTVVRWADPAGGAHPAPTLTLLPATPGAARGGHGGHGGAVGGAPADPAGQAPADPSGQDPAAPGRSPAADDRDGPSADLLLGGGLLAGLGGGAAIGWLLSRRRPGALALPPEESDGDGAGGAGDGRGDGGREGSAPADPRPDDRPTPGDGTEPVLADESHAAIGPAAAR